MVTHSKQPQPISTDCKAANQSGYSQEAISAIVEELIVDRDIQNIFGSIEESNRGLGKIIDNLAHFGQAKDLLQLKCCRVIEAKFKGKCEDSVKEEAKALLYKALIQTKYPNSNLEELLDSGFDINVWRFGALSYVAAEAVQAKLDLLELGSGLGGHYRVSQRLISVGKDHPIYIKTLVLTNDQISGTDWVGIERCFERLTEKGLIEAALPFEKFQKECRQLAASNGRPKLYGAVEAWISEVLEIVSKHYGAAIAEIFSVELKPGEIELNSLSVDELQELEKVVDEAIPDCELPSIAKEVSDLEAKLRSPLNWPSSLLGLLKKTLGKVIVTRPVLNKRGALTLEKWGSISRKIKPAEEKVKSEQLAIRLEEIKHWHRVQKRLNLDEGQLKELQTRVWDRAYEKHSEFTLDDNAALDRPVGKVGKAYMPIPWVSDVLEVLPSLSIENKEELPLIPYDLGVFVEEYDIQIVADKYKFDQETITALKYTVDEIAITNKRPLDPITGRVRAWKDDLYQAIALEDHDATKLLKKEAPKYSLDDVEELVEEKTGEIKEELNITKQQLNEEKQSREQLQTEISSLKEQLTKERTERQQFEQEMRQFMAQQQAITTNGNGNGNGHQSVAVEPS